MPAGTPGDVELDLDDTGAPGDDGPARPAQKIGASLCVDATARAASTGCARPFTSSTASWRQFALRVDGSGGTARDGIYWIRPRIDVPSQP